MGGILPTQTYQSIYKKIPFEYLRNKLKIKSLEAKNAFSDKYPHVERYLKKKGIEVEKIREHSARLLGAGILTGTLILASPPEVKLLPSPQEILDKFHLDEEKPEVTDPNKLLINTFQSILPKKVKPLDRNEEKILEQIFINLMGISARGSLEGEHLNTTYGLIGAEQHLRRYPGDTLLQHGDGRILKEGMAPGLGAWGYFSPTKSGLTPDLIETEKWYAVVQTLYLPDWEKRFRYLRDWYKYRKVLIVNTKNGNAAVAAIADSGPAMWTGKNFGGSPEVMSYLGGDRYKKGPVIVFFVDDPENKIPLGPLEYNR